jgi:hypothetical protein
LFITSADIVNNTIRGKDVRNRTLTLRDLSRSTVASLRGQQGPRGPRGPQGLQGLIGPTGPRGTTNISYVTGAPVSVPGGEAGSSFATCPAGTSPTGGGDTLDSELALDGLVIQGQDVIVFAFNRTRFPLSYRPTLLARGANASARGAVPIFRLRGGSSYVVTTTTLGASNDNRGRLVGPTFGVADDDLREAASMSGRLPGE